MALFLRKGQVVNMNQTYMKEQKILPLLLKMSLPMVISMMVNSLYNIVDSFFVAKISENAMTALSLVFPLQNLISSVMIGFAIGINAVISFFMGAQNQKQADKAASQGMLLSCIHAVVLTVICIAGMPVFLKMFTKDAEIVSLGLKYSNIAFAFSIMLGIELKEGLNAREIVEKCISKGIIPLTAKNKIRLLLPLNISKKDLEKAIRILSEVLK